MVDNVDISEGDASKVVRSDDVGGFQYQIVKVDLGADGASSGLVRGQQIKANSLPVTLASDEDTVPVNADGNIGQQAKAASLPVTLANDEDTVPVNVDGAIGQQAMAASLSVAIANNQSDVPVVGGDAKDAAPTGIIAVGGVYKAPVAGDDVDSTDVAPILTDEGGAVVLGRNPGAFNTTEEYVGAETDNPHQAAPGANLALRVKTLRISSDGTAAGSVQIIEDTGVAATKIGGKYYFPDTAGMIEFHFDPPLQVTTNKDVGVTTLGVTNLTVEMDGYTVAA